MNTKEADMVLAERPGGVTLSAHVHAALGNLSGARQEENGDHCFWGLAAVAPPGAAVADHRGPDEARHC